jgi:hypothetical protein
LWWTLLAGELRSTGDTNQNALVAGDTPYYERRAGLPEDTKLRKDDWEPIGLHVTAIGAEQEGESELDKLRREIAYLRAEMNIVRQSPALGERRIARTATRGWVQAQDALLLVLLIVAVVGTNWRVGTRLDRMEAQADRTEARVEAIEKWTEQDFLVR